MTILTYPSTQPCEYCDVDPSARGVRVREFHLMGRNTKVPHEIIACEVCVEQIATVLGIEAGRPKDR